MIGRVWKSKEPFWIADIAASDGEMKYVRKAAALKSGLQSALAFPIMIDQRLYAIWEFYSTNKRPEDLHFVEVARRLSNHLSVVYEKKLAEKTLADLSARLMKSQDEEHRRVARELHDSTAQTLSAAMMNLTAVHEEAAALSPRAARLLAECDSLLADASDEIRTIAHLLHPQVLDQVGLESAVRGYVAGFAQRSGVLVDLEFPENLGRLPQEIEIALFRIVQEGLNNVYRHAEVDKAKIRIAVDDSEVALELMDKGKGLPASLRDSSGIAPESTGLGIASMRERVKELGGRFELKSGKRGTTVRAVLPVKRG
jgi:signal transduction histidine kinase